MGYSGLILTFECDEKIEKDNVILDINLSRESRKYSGIVYIFQGLINTHSNDNRAWLVRRYDRISKTKSYLIYRDVDNAVNSLVRIFLSSCQDDDVSFDIFIAGLEINQEENRLIVQSLNGQFLNKSWDKKDEISV